jgi:CD81 antigen
MQFTCLHVQGLIEFYFIYVLQLVGIAAVAAAVWMLVDPTFMISLAQEQQNYQYALFILLGLGVLMVLLAFCGCCGALKESTCMLVSFFCCMLIVVTAEIAAGVWAYQNSDKLELFVKTNLKHTISNEYKVVESRTEIVDLIQAKMQCCG